jgi:hypothetical protein
MQQPSSDLISEVVQSQLTSDKITREQLVAHAFLLLVAGAWVGLGLCHILLQYGVCWLFVVCCRVPRSLMMVLKLAAVAFGVKEGAAAQQ